MVRGGGACMQVSERTQKGSLCLQKVNETSSAQAQGKPTAEEVPRTDTTHAKVGSLRRSAIMAWCTDLDYGALLLQCGGPRVLFCFVKDDPS